LKIGIYQDYELIMQCTKLCSHVMELPQNAAIKFSAMYAFFLTPAVPQQFMTVMN